MPKHKFLTPGLIASAVLISRGMSPNGITGRVLIWLISFVSNLMLNAGLGVANLVVVDFATDKERKEFDQAQEISLDPVFVASLTKEERRVKSKDFRSKFRKFASFGFLRNK